MDAFFFPRKGAVRRGFHGPKLDLGIDANALVEILTDCGEYRHMNGDGSFGVLKEETLRDHHRAEGGDMPEAATCTLFVKKFGEGFVPHRDNAMEWGEPRAIQQLSESVLRAVFLELTASSP